MSSSNQNNTYAGIGLAVLAVVIWSGNFIVSRGVITQIAPVSLAFYRWATATLIMLPIAWRKSAGELPVIRAHTGYLFFVSLTGIALFNTFVYVAGHYTSAINLALIGTTSSPIFATVLAVIFLREKLGIFRIAGIAICVAGILLLLAKGSWSTLFRFRFSTGDLWVLAGALAFAVYNVLVRRKPAGLSAVSFLFSVFAMGTLLLFAFFLWELNAGAPTQWSWQLAGVILYLGAGTSVVAFLCWNIAIQRLGAVRTALFGNLIPIFSTLEAVWLLGEDITSIHLASGALVVAGLVLANRETTRVDAREAGKK